MVVVVVIFVIDVVVVVVVVVAVFVALVLPVVLVVLLSKRIGSKPDRIEKWSTRLVLLTFKRAPVEPVPMLSQLFIG